MNKAIASFFLLFFTFSLLEVASAVDVEVNSVPGTTYSIGNGFTGGTHPEGSHFHSSNLDELPAGNPPIIFPGAAEVGGFFGDEEVRGVSEFVIESDTVAAQAQLSFDVLDTFAFGLSPEFSGIDGLFGQGPLDGVVDVFPYVADGVESFSDYQATPITDDPILSIVVGDGLEGGDTLTVDITSIYNELSASGDALGIRLQMADPDPDAGAITFHNFRIDVTPVPEPTSGLIAAILAGAMLCVRRRSWN